MTTQFACQRFATAAEFFAEDVSCGFNVDDDTTMIESLLDQSSDILYHISGGRIHGICTSTVRPFSPYPAHRGDWMNWSWPGHDFGPYTATHENYNGDLATVPLRGPNTDVVTVYIDGVVLNPSEYGLLDNYKLFRKGGLTWPTSNDLTKDLSQVGTWGITFRFGRTPDYVTKQAVIEMASELGAPLKGRESNLPAGVTSANIQGASITVQDRAEALRDGDQQIPAISRFVGLYAPSGRGVSGVWSPELRHGLVLVEDEGPSGS